MIEKMTKEAERRIVRAVEDTIKLVKSGEAPNAALVQVVKPLDFTPEMVKRSAEAYNVSKTLSFLHEKKGEARTGVFDTIDSTKVLHSLYPDNYPAPGSEKAAAVAESNPFVYAPPTNLIERKAYAGVVKAASFESQVAHSYEVPVETRWDVVERQMDEHDALTKIARARTMAAGMAKVVMHQDLSKAAEAIQVSLYNTPFERVERAMFYKYGEEAKPLTALLFRSINGEALREKRAARLLPVLADFREDPYRSVDDFVQAARAYNRVEAEKQAALAKVAEHTTERTAQEAVRFPFAYLPSLDKVAAPVSSKWTMPAGGGQPPQQNGKDKKKEEDKKEKAKTPSFMDVLGKPGALLPMTMGLGGGLSKTLSGAGLTSEPAYQKELSQAMMEVENPDHRDATRSVEAQSLLHHLMTNDEVVSTYEPQEVLDAYNQVAKLAPDVSTQPMVMTGMIRRMLTQGYAEPMEAGQISSIEKARQETKSPGGAYKKMMEASPISTNALRGVGTTAPGGDDKKPAGGNAKGLLRIGAPSPKPPMSPNSSLLRGGSNPGEV